MGESPDLQLNHLNAVPAAVSAHEADPAVRGKLDNLRLGARRLFDKVVGPVLVGAALLAGGCDDGSDEYRVAADTMDVRDAVGNTFELAEGNIVVEDVMFQEGADHLIALFSGIEADKKVEVIYFDYEGSPIGNGLGLIQSDGDSYGKLRINQVPNNAQVVQVVNGAQKIPFPRSTPQAFSR